MAGLQDMAPMVASFWVSRRVRAPMRALAAAASAPAWPPPMTITSKLSMTGYVPRPTGSVKQGAGPDRRLDAIAGYVHFWPP